MDVSPNQQRSLQFSLRTLLLFVAATAIFFALARWTDYLTAGGILLGLLPLAAALLYRRPLYTLVFCLFLTGWVLPSIFPHYAVAFGANGLRSADSYWLHVYVGEAGFFSRGLTIENTWEGTHGHSWPIGPWIPGYLLSFSVFASGTLALCYARRLSKVIMYLGVMIQPMLVGFAFHSFMLDDEWFCIIAGCGYIIYLVFAYCFHRQIKHEEESARLRKLVGLVLTFYPWWVLALALAQHVFPFFGWLATFAGCLILMFGPESWLRQKRMDRESLGGRIRILFGVGSAKKISP